MKKIEKKQLAIKILSGFLAALMIAGVVFAAVAML